MPHFDIAGSVPERRALGERSKFLAMMAAQIAGGILSNHLTAYGAQKGTKDYFDVSNVHVASVNVAESILLQIESDPTIRKEW